MTKMMADSLAGVENRDHGRTPSIKEENESTHKNDRVHQAQVKLKARQNEPKSQIGVHGQRDGGNKRRS